MILNKLYKINIYAPLNKKIGNIDVANIYKVEIVEKI